MSSNIVTGYAALDTSVDLRTAPDSFVASYLAREWTAFFSGTTARRYGLQSPIDRFHVATHEYPNGFLVPPNTFRVIDDVHNRYWVIERSDLGRHGLNVLPYLAMHLGLTNNDLRRVFKCQTLPRLPWFANGERIYTALTLIRGFFAPVLDIDQARKLGLSPTERWVLQTDGADYWVRDCATNVCTQVLAQSLASGLSMVTLLRSPEYFNKPGELCFGRNAYRPIEPGEDWTSSHLVANVFPSRTPSPVESRRSARYSGHPRREERRTAGSGGGEPARAPPGLRRVASSLALACQKIADKSVSRPPQVTGDSSGTDIDMPELLPVSDSSGSESSLSSVDDEAADSLLRRMEPYDAYMRRTQRSDEGPFDYESDGARS